MIDPRANQQIDSILQLDLDTITFSDIHWRYGTFWPYSTGSGRDKKHFSRSGVATPIGDIQEDLWYQVAEHIAKREGEEWLVDALTQWNKEHNYMKESPSELRKDALQSYSHRLYDNPRWVDFIPFNRRFRPEVLESARLVKVVLDAYAEAFQQLLPDRPLIQVTGSTTTFAKRRALRRSLKETGNGILLCTQQSLPSSVNFEYVNKIILPELHYNNSGMSQFYMRFIRYTSTEFKDIYFLTYAGSLESNLMQMVVAKEKINLFMKGKDADLDEIYDKFGIDYNLLELLMRRELDEEGHFQIRWGEQLIA